MTKAIFYIEDKVQDVGYRIFIMEKILNSNLKGTAVNTRDGRIKVLLEGEKEKIIKFYEELREELPDLAKNPMRAELKFDEKLEVPDPLYSSQALQLNQFGKAVVKIDGLGNKIDRLGINLSNKIDGLGNKIDGLGDNLSNKIDVLGTNLSNKIDGLGIKLVEELPERIAKAIKTSY